MLCSNIETLKLKSGKTIPPNSTFNFESEDINFYIVKVDKPQDLHGYLVKIPKTLFDKKFKAIDANDIIKKNRTDGLSIVNLLKSVSSELRKRGEAKLALNADKLITDIEATNLALKKERFKSAAIPSNKWYKSDSSDYPVFFIERYDNGYYVIQYPTKDKDELRPEERIREDVIKRANPKPITRDELLALGYEIVPEEWAQPLRSGR